MKKILLSLLLVASVTAVFSQAFPCPIDFRVNNGGGSCPDTVINGVTLSATGTVRLTFDGPVPPNNIPRIVRVIEVLASGDTVITGISFGRGTLNSNGTVTYCYYAGPNNNNNLNGGGRDFRFVVFFGQMPCGSQSPLPVSFKSFTAARNRSNVIVKWETASEQNNSGFAVERNVNGTWQQISFVPTQATNGISSSVLLYQYIDVNNTKGISQYRILQVDLDGKTKYSETRAVRGDGQSVKTIIYPNPTMDGKVNVIFEDAGSNTSRNISVSDMSGRTVRMLTGVITNTVTIDNLTPGMYSLRILVPATGVQTVEKIVVNKR